MIQSLGAVTTQQSFGLENPARFGPQAAKGAAAARSGKVSLGTVNELTPEQQRQVDQLKEIDRKVRAHEQAHLAVGAELVRGGASFTYETGPDQRRYAVAGEVSIDATPGRTPEETIPKAQRIRAAALAPVDPSPQDRSVAAAASRMEGDARLEIALQQREKKTETGANSGAVFYRGVERSSRAATQLGSLLDSFA